MNNVAISPHVFMYALQNQNVERKLVRSVKGLEEQGEVKEVKEENNVS